MNPALGPPQLGCRVHASLLAGRRAERSPHRSFPHLPSYACRAPCCRRASSCLRASPFTRSPPTSSDGDGSPRCGCASDDSRARVLKPSAPGMEERPPARPLNAAPRPPLYLRSCSSSVAVHHPQAPLHMRSVCCRATMPIALPHTPARLPRRPPCPAASPALPSGARRPPSGRPGAWLSSRSLAAAPCALPLDTLSIPVFPSFALLTHRFPPTQIHSIVCLVRSDPTPPPSTAAWFFLYIPSPASNQVQPLAAPRCVHARSDFAHCVPLPLLVSLFLRLCPSPPSPAFTAHGGTTHAHTHTCSFT